MKLFTKEIDSKLFEQYKMGSDLENQKVVAKIFNPYGRGTWYLLNSDPQDPDYIWAIVDFFEVEMGSVSRSELQGIKVPPFGLGLERDMSFTPINAKELFKGLLNGEHYKDGGIMLDKDFNAIEKEYKENEDNNAHSENVVLLADNFGTEEEKAEAKEILEKHNEEGSLSSELRNRRSVLEEKLWDKYQALKKIYAEGGSVYNIEKYLSKNLINHIGSLNKEELVKMKKELSYEISRSEKYDKDFKGSNREFSLNKELDFINHRLEEKYESGGQTTLFGDGGNVAEQNKEMLKNQAKEFMHHSQELNELVGNVKEVDAWVVAKAERASTDLSDITHYLEGKMAKGRMMAKGGLTKEAIVRTLTSDKEQYFLQKDNDGYILYISPKGALNSTFHEKFNVESLGNEGTRRKYRLTKMEDGGMMAKGGKMNDEEGIDLFEDYNDQPKDVQKIIDAHEQDFEDGDYKKLEKILKKLNKIGYTFEYGLDGGAYDLRPIGTKGKSEFNDDFDFAKGGELVPYIVWTSKDGDKREFFGEFKSQRSAKIKADKLWETGEYEAIGYKPKSSYEKQGLYFEDGGMMAKGGYVAVSEKDDYWYIMSKPTTKEKAQELVDMGVPRGEMGKIVTIAEAKAHKKVIGKEYLASGGKMAMGGATFKDKVNAISKRLEGKKVPTRLKKDYGATYDKKEAKQAGQRIAGSMLQKIKMRKK